MTPVTVSVDVTEKVSVMTSPALASVVVALSEASPAGVITGAAVSIMTVPRIEGADMLPAASVCDTTTLAAPLASPAWTV